jgi:hypothetical protein
MWTMGIIGYRFTRAELNSLINSTGYDEMFLMLALSPDANNNKYIQLAIAPLHNGNIDLNHIIVSASEPFTHEIDFSDVVEAYSSNKSIVGEQISLKELRDMHADYKTATSSDLNCTTDNDKIKAYVLNRLDILDLTLNSATNGQDTFLFIPVIRKKRQNDADNVKQYMSIAIAKFNTQTKKVEGKIREYCLPCPSTCAANYWHK